MVALASSEDRRVKYILVSFAFLMLAACLAYSIYLLWAAPRPGITFNARWEVMHVDVCNADPETCPDVNALQQHDRLVSIGGLHYEDIVEDPSLVPFGDFLPGELVPLTIQRDGRNLEVEWRMQHVQFASVVRFSVISLLVYGSFWVAGTFVLLYMRPADQTWTLMVSLFYLVTIWLATGLVPTSYVAYSAIILRVVGWLIAPVMIHLHLIVPNTQLPTRTRSVVAALYVAAVALLVLQIAGMLPWLAYLGALLLSALVCIGLLTYRVLTPRAPAEKMTAQLMLAGILLALVPGLVLIAIPLLLDISGSDIIGAAMSILALPMLPLFYIYAIYKHRLGARERRVNRILVQYALFLLYFILLTLVFVILSVWAWTANSLLSFVVLVGLAATVALLPIRSPVQIVFDRLTYGTRYSHRTILNDFTDRIPGAVDRQELVHLLKYELAPQMEIRQSALYVRQGTQVESIYAQGIGHNDSPASWNEAEAIMDQSEEFLGARGWQGRDAGNHLAWVRLVVPLRVKGQTIGAWLFGHRESDDIYSQEDVDLLDRLSGLVAVTLESSQLFDALSDELEIRRQTELRLAEQSEQLRMLHEIDRAILASGTPADIARAAFDGIGQLVPCVRQSVFLFNEDRQSMTILAAQGSGANVVADNNIFQLDKLSEATRILQGRPYVNQDFRRTSPQSGLVQLLEPLGLRAVISAPLLATGTVFGALNVGNDIPDCFESDHVAVVEEVANSVALAIHNARLREELDTNSRELQLLSARLIGAQEVERKRLSHELHDEMGQLLTAISLKLATIERNLPPNSDESLRQQLGNANEFVLGLTNQVRSLSFELRPSMLHDLGLVSTLRWYVSNYDRRSEAKVWFESDEFPERLPEDIEIIAYRVVQEALTNAGRHSAATKINLAVRCLNGCLQLTVEDNGRGFDPRPATGNKAPYSGIGLIMMRERVSAVSGRLEVHSEPGKGTRISAEIPIRGIA